MLSSYRTFKLLKRYFCTHAPRLDISLTKKSTTFKFVHDLPVAVFYAMVFANEIFSKRMYFFSNLQTCKYTLFWKFVNSKKILPVGTRLDISLKKLPRHSNLHTTYLSRYSMRWYSEKNISQPGVFFFPIYKLLKKKGVFRSF